MEQMPGDILEKSATPGPVTGDTPTGAGDGGSGSSVVSDPGAIIAGLRGEMDRVCLTNDSSCICIVSPDGTTDDVLMEILGAWITARLRSNDALYRIAPDKYLVMLRQIERDEAVGFIKSLREQVISQPVPSPGGNQQANTTASFGGTMLDPLTPLHEHMDRASEAHDWALKGMGDTICMWTPRF
ncbi:MAG: diguanylate cyclase [Rhodospirillales bacterium]|nr:MAG: diguanylate cyclase [Rhodospirillales bacterium]